jgi:hypothetical protein
MKNPPILISVLGFFAALAGFGFLFFGLRVIGFDWFGAFGDLPKYESAGIWGWLAVGTGDRLAARSPWPLGAPAVGATVRADHRWLRPVRGGPGVHPVPGDRRRLRHGDHARADHLVPELR